MVLILKKRSRNHGSKRKCHDPSLISKNFKSRRLSSDNVHVGFSLSHTKCGTNSNYVLFSLLTRTTHVNMTRGLLSWIEVPTRKLCTTCFMSRRFSQFSMPPAKSNEIVAHKIRERKRDKRTRKKKSTRVGDRKNVNRYHHWFYWILFNWFEKKRGGGENITVLQNKTCWSFEYRDTEPIIIIVAYE